MADFEERKALLVLLLPVTQNQGIVLKKYIEIHLIFLSELDEKVISLWIQYSLSLATYKDRIQVETESIALCKQNSN